MPRKQVFHILDRVTIKNPQMFLRAGYPFNKQYAKEHLITEQDKCMIFDLVGIKNLATENSVQNNTFDKILDELAYLRLCEAGFGGNERKIFTKEYPEFKGKIGQVVGKKVVQTGKRGYYTEGCLEEGGTYSVPYLEEQKSHVILEIRTDDLIDNNWPRIEEIHVEKLPQDNGLKLVKGGWLEGVLADAVAEKAKWPDWAKNNTVVYES